MPRYFLEVSYKGTAYSGFQIQDNAGSIQEEVEKALVGSTPSEDLFREFCEECRKVDAIDDVHAPASYRQHLAAVMSRRALVAAQGRVDREGRRRFSGRLSCSRVPSR